MRQTELPAWLSLWLPVLCVFSLLGINLVAPEFYRAWIEQENGFVELATPAILIAGIYHGVQAVRRNKPVLPGWIRGWIVIIILACFYFAGEELSWGQQIYGWTTPERLTEINDQNETNFHNTSSWFDQKPRLVLELWVLIGGVILPLGQWLNKTGYAYGSWRYWFWPSAVCLPSAVIAILIRVPERIKDVFGLQPYSYELRWSEIQELYFAAFLSLYLLSIHQRLRQSADTGSGIESG
ncbi:MAG: hypothetical protein MI673_10825 [Thiotrichales bacterium]|nr:hypothetical protein [Thiotrichales bacterium]